MKTHRIEWLVTDGRDIKGMAIDDHYWSVEQVMENPILHALYHEALKELKDERTRNKETDIG